MKRRSLLILSALAVLMASCGNKGGGKSGLMVPEDAALVIHINSQSLSSKLSWEEIKQTDWFKFLSSKKRYDDDSAASLRRQQLLDDPASSGVDTKSDFIVYLKKRGRGSYMVIAGSLADASAFEKLITTKKNGVQPEVKKSGGFSYVAMEDDIVIWDKSHFASVSNAFIPNMNNRGKRYDDDDDDSFSGTYKFSVDSLKEFGASALSLSDNANLDKDSRFATLVKDGNDVHFWLNSTEFSGGMNAAMPMASDLLKGNIMAASINFDNGKIAGKAKQYYGEAMAKLMAANKPKPVSADVINRIPSSDVLGVIAFNISPEGLKEILRKTNMDAMADYFLGQYDISIDDIIKATNGEFLVSFSDLKSKPVDENMGYAPSKPDMNVLFAVSINDKGAFEKLATLIWDMSKNLKKSGGGGNTPDFYSKVGNNWFAASSSEAFMTQFLAGSSTAKQPFADKITGKPMGVYLDLQKLIPVVAPSRDSMQMQIRDIALSTWQDIVVTGGDFKDGAMEFEGQINFVDKNVNSLKQLNQFIDKMTSMRKEYMGKRPGMKTEELMPDDSDATKDAPPAK